MATLADLITPTFLMFLGILVLVVALLVVYIESKMRDQNHKIASMLSLVSTLAEDMNGVKMELVQLAGTRTGNSFPQNYEQSLENQRRPYNQEPNLIEVSDESDNDNSDDDDSDDNDDNSDDIDDSDNDDDNSTHDVKILNLNISTENDFEDLVEINKLDEELDEELDEVQSLSSKSSKLSDTLQETQVKDKMTESLNISLSDLKTISINNLEESHDELLDYKKLSLPKLRSIVSEKGLASDTSKLKKNELLNLLGYE